MPEIEYNCSARVTLSETEREQLVATTEKSIAELGAQVLYYAKGDCDIKTWSDLNAGQAGSAKRKIETPCAMALEITDEPDTSTNMIFTCTKALCRDNGAPLRSADKVIARVREGTN